MNSPLLLATHRPADKVGINFKSDRQQRRIPAVLYGNHIPTQHLYVNLIDLQRVLRHAGESSLVSLKVDAAHPVNVLIQDWQKNPLTGEYTHVDFYQVDMKQKVKTSIPLHFEGIAPAVKSLGGILLHPLNEVEVTCLPADLISHIEVDISVLNDFQSIIKVSDIKVPSTIEILNNPDDVVALVERPRSDAELAALNEKVEIDVTQVAKIEKEKKEEDTIDESN